MRDSLRLVAAGGLIDPKLYTSEYEVTYDAMLQQEKKRPWRAHFYKNKTSRSNSQLTCLKNKYHFGPTYSITLHPSDPRTWGDRVVPETRNHSVQKSKDHFRVHLQTALRLSGQSFTTYKTRSHSTHVQGVHVLRCRYSGLYTPFVVGLHAFRVRGRVRTRSVMASDTGI